MPMILGPLLADPPIFTFAEFKQMSIADVMDAIELLHLREELHERARGKARREAEQRKRR